MNWEESTHFLFALLGWFIFIADQWQAAVQKHKQGFSWKVFRQRNTATFVFNFLCMIAVFAIASNVQGNLSIAESVGSGYLASQFFKNRFKRKANETNKI